MDEETSAATPSPAARTPSRRRIVGAFAVVTLTPIAFGLLLAEGADRRELDREVTGALSIAAAATLVRGLGVSGRWLTIGPGQVIDRRLWGWFLLLVSSILVERLFGFGVGFLAFGYALAYMIFWNLSRRDGRDDFSQLEKVSRFSLGDAIVALALFSLLAWLLASGIDWRRSGTVSDLFDWIAALPFVTFPALVGYLSDAGFLDAALKPGGTGRKTLCWIASIAAAVLLASCLSLGTRDYVHVLLAPPIFVSVYALTAVAQEATLARLGIREGESLGPSERQESSRQERR